MTLKDAINRRLYELGIPEDHMVGIKDPNTNIETGSIYLEDLIVGMIREFTKKKWRCDLNFWLKMYDIVQLEQQMCIEDSNYLYENFGRPSSDEQKEKQVEIHSRQLELNDIEQFIRQRILKYNR